MTNTRTTVISMKIAKKPITLKMRRRSLSNSAFLNATDWICSSLMTDSIYLLFWGAEAGTSPPSDME
jgi:hypothetical protein